MFTWRRAGLVATAAALFSSLMSVAPLPAGADSAPPGCAGMDPFTPAFANQLAVRWPGQRFTASVYDERTGCQFDLHAGMQLTEASVEKVEVMAGILLRAQSEGRPLSDQERSLIQPMITESHDAPTNVLWQSLGGAAGMTSLDHVFGLTETTQMTQWGITLTSARDQVHLLRQVLVGDIGPLGPSYRADAVGYMTSVIPSQRWGITAGVPAGWTVANKNGFYGSTCCAWRINTTGVVFDPAGGGYVIAILSDGWPDQATGVPGVETVSRAVAASLRSAAPQTPAVVAARQGPSAGTLSAYLNGRDGGLYTTWQTSPGSTWQAAQRIGGNPPGGGLTDSPTVLLATTGPFANALSAYGRAGDGGLYTTWQTQPGSLWAGWQRIGGTPPAGGIQGSPAVVATTTGPLTGALSAYARAGDGGLYTTWQTQPGSLWAGWQRIGAAPPAGGIQGSPAVVMSSPGALSAYARAGDGALYTTWQSQPGSLWNPWQRIGGGAPAGGLQGAGAPSMVTASGGALSAYARAGDGALYTTWQSQPGSLWNPWQRIGGAPPAGGIQGTPAAILATAGPYAGVISAFARAGDGSVYTAWQTQPGGLWASWAPIGGTPPRALNGSPTVIESIVLGTAGALSLYAVGADAGLYTTWQGRPGSTWAAWQRIGG